MCVLDIVGCFVSFLIEAIEYHFCGLIILNAPHMPLFATRAIIGFHELVILAHALCHTKGLFFGVFPFS